MNCSTANASKARQATSRAKQIDKIKVEEFVASSRQYPYIRFDYDDKDKLHRQAVEIKNLSHGFDHTLFNNFNLLVEAGERIAVIGENGIGKTTLDQLTILASQHNKSWFEIMENSHYFGLKAANLLTDFVLMIRSFQTMMAKPAYDVAMHVAKQTGLLKSLYDDSFTSLSFPTYLPPWPKIVSL